MELLSHVAGKEYFCQEALSPERICLSVEWNLRAVEILFIWGSEFFNKTRMLGKWEVIDVIRPEESKSC